MPACAMKHCKNKSSINNKASGITYHRFPADPVMYDQWLHIVRLLQEESCWKPTKNTVICSIHFKESDLFMYRDGSRRLHKKAVPMRELVLSSTLHKNNYITTELSTSVPPGKTAGNETSPSDNFSGVDCMSVDSACDIDTEQKVSTLDMEYNKLTTEDHNNISFNTEDTKIFRLDQWNSKVSGKVCRICLAVDGKMFNIGHYKLKQYYQNLTGILFSQEDTLPKMMCWECVARLQNANSFREKALRSYDLLLKNIKSETTVSMTDVRSINRVENGLTSALAVAHMSDVSCGTHSDDVTTTEVKEEVDMWSETEVIDTEDQEQQDQEDPLEDPQQQDQEDQGDHLEDHEQQDQEDSLEDHEQQDQEDSLEDHEQQDQEDSLEDHEQQDQEDSLEDHEQQDQEDSLEDHEQQDQEDQENPLDTRLARRLSSSSQTRDPERPARAKKTTKTSARVARRAAQRPELDSSIFEVVAVPMERALAEAAQRATCPQYLAAQHRCDVCYKTFTTPTAKEEHALRHSDVMGLFECAVCRCRWRTRNAVVKHITASHATDHICKLCPFFSRHRSAARAHVRFHKGVKFQCSLCPKEFVSQTTYLGHLRLSHVCRHPCALCGFTFLTRRGVNIHMLMKHKRHKDVELTGPYCAECDVRFATDDAHDRHLQLSVVHRREDTQNSSQPLRNDYAVAEKRKYRGMSKMKSGHTKTKRAKPKQRTLICCEQCGETCEGYRVYMQHFRRQHPGCNRTQYSGTDPVMCEHCGKLFQHPCHLRVHAAELVAGKPCGPGLTDGRADASRRLYACPLCPKRFTEMRNRARHIATIHHGAERRFRCSVCDKRFWERSGLQLHYDHVHLKKPWPRRTRLPRPRPAPATGQELESIGKDASAEI